MTNESKRACTMSSAQKRTNITEGSGFNANDELYASGLRDDSIHMPKGLPMFEHHD